MIALVLACGGESPPEPRPEGVPEAAAFLRYSGNDLKLDDQVLAPWRTLEENRDEPLTVLEDALGARMVKEAGTWVALPGNASWGEARRAVQAVFQANAGPLWLGALGTGKAVGPLDNQPGGQAFPSCDEPVPVVGVGKRLTLELHADADQTWMDATLRFKPLVRLPGKEPVLAELLDRKCWQPTTCAVLGSPDAVAACEQGFGSTEPVSDRVEVGGEHGCMVPFAKKHDHTRWPVELTKSLAQLGVGPETGTLVMADETVELDAVLASLHGLVDEGIRSPQLGMLRMGSGDVAGLCDAPVRDAAALQQAAARWFGHQLSTGGSP